MKVTIVIIVVLLGFAVAGPIDADGYYRVPMRGKVPKECVHHVPSGSHIENTKAGIVVTTPTGEIRNLGSCLDKYPAKLAKKNVGDYDGWLAYTAYEAPVDFDVFVGYFSVPDEPQNVPEELYLFTGLQNVNWIPIVDPEPAAFDIIQPVLQYPADGGSYWSVKSWYVTLTNDVLFSDEIQVNVGDLIYGNMTKTGPTTWYIGGTDGTQNTFLSVNRDILATQPWAYNTAECYGCEGCSYEPTQPIQFTKLLLEYQGKQVVPNWTPLQSPNPQCHETAHVVDDETVSISFQ